jgi:hypothetical protein
MTGHDSRIFSNRLPPTIDDRESIKTALAKNPAESQNHREVTIITVINTSQAFDLIVGPLRGMICGTAHMFRAHKGNARGMSAKQAPA